ncbi:tyrosine-type recombinase/integrase [Suttonella sp. R2A3]|uniref:tyrosine-type recombinase/integrase n=1 Tax=Suttonella sp. R2A3 TaxID=2908648 RepID=UPI001F45A11E|nr:integrase arm-type DNA-binding domain-containing protein [Suttonella sp. R2A3]UJF24768.1 tyrosine-type recombinase/integrase [Suttonella sp. R2A3]
MAGKLSDRFCKTVAELGKYADGGGLSFRVTKSGKYWQGRYRFDGKAKTASYGVYPQVSLVEARAAHAALKLKLADGIDPMAEKKQAKKEKEIEEKAAFDKFALDWVAVTSETKGWSKKHIKIINGFLNLYILPAFGASDIREIYAPEIVRFAQGLEKQGKHETARKCLRTVTRILTYAVVLGIRESNPAVGLHGVLSKHDAENMRHEITPDGIGRVLLALERAETTLPAVRAFIKLQPMLFTRPSELRTMRWDELNLEEALLQKSADAMKTRREHLVPLPKQALAIIEEMKQHTGHCEYVLANTRTGKPISEGAAHRLKIRNGLHDVITWHGWRHTASTLLNEQGYNADHIEMQLAHVSGGTRAVYNKARYLEPRREMMQEWADYLDGLLAQAKEAEKHS